MEDNYSDYERASELEELEQRRYDFMLGNIPNFIAPSFKGAERASLKRKASPTLKEIALMEETQRLGLNVENPNEETNTKRRLLSEVMGYRNLNCPKTEQYPKGRKPLNRCEPERIGTAFARVYFTAQRKLS